MKRIVCWDGKHTNESPSLLQAFPILKRLTTTPENVDPITEKGDSLDANAEKKHYLWQEKQRKVYIPANNEETRRYNRDT